MCWKAPSYELIPMDAEIGSYQEDPAAAVTDGGLLSVTVQSPGTGSPIAYPMMPGTPFTSTKLSPC
jgi:hypothetical protein